MDDKKRFSKWVLPVVIIISVLLVCGTVLIVSFKSEFISWYHKARESSTERTTKERSRKEMYLQFSKKEQKELSVKTGTVSVTEKPLYDNFPYVWLGKPLVNPLPKNCSSVSGELLTQAALRWKERGYDGFYICTLKTHGFKWNNFLESVLLFTEKGSVKRIRWILDYENLPTTKKEYNALSYDLAGNYGLPAKEVFEIDKGYEDNLEAYQNERVRANRTFKAKGAEINIYILKSTGITIDYYFPKAENKDEKIK